MAQVFISYSRRDLPFVEQLVSDLKKTGLNVWYDLSGLEGGSRWRVEIQNAIRKSEYVIVVLSPDSVESEWVEREYLFSSNLKRKILPILYRPCELPLNFLDLNYIDVQGENYSRNFHKILQFLDIESEGLPSPTYTPAARSSFNRNMTSFVGLFGLGVVILLVGAASVFILCRNGNCQTPGPTSVVPEATQVPSEVPGLPGSTASATPTETQLAAETPPATTPPTPTDTPTQITCIPLPVSPSAGAVLDNGRTDHGNDIIWDIKWETCPDATQYQLYVKHENAVNPVIDITTADSSYQHVSSAYIADINRLNWTWRVRALVQGEWGDWSPSIKFDVELVNTDPAEADKINFTNQESYQGDCRNRPSGTTCAKFPDDYLWLINDSVMEWKDGGFWQGNAVSIAVGHNADYYHVLNTSLVKVVPK